MLVYVLTFADRFVGLFTTVDGGMAEAASMVGNSFEDGSVVPTLVWDVTASGGAESQFFTVTFEEYDVRYEIYPRYVSPN